MAIRMRGRLEKAHRRLRELSSLRFALLWLCVTVPLSVTMTHVILMPPWKEYEALHQRDISEASLVAQGVSLRKNIERTSLKIRERRAEMESRFGDGANTISLEEEVVHMTDRIRSANLQSVSISRESLAADSAGVSLVATFKGSFENVGIFLSSLRRTTLVGLALLDADFTQEASGQLSVRLSWSFRAVTRPPSLCDEPADR